MSKIKRIGITTGGGDAPGLNAVIRAVTKAALKRGWEVFGIRNGFDGVMYPEKFPDGGLTPLDSNSVRGISHMGGTILGTTNRGNPFSYEVSGPDGKPEKKNLSKQLLAGINEAKLDAVVSLGGDGSMAIANEVAKLGVRVIGVPKTIDNDLAGTVATFGFDTAVSFATDAIGRLHSTASAHQRVMIVEVMGRYAGWIALHAGVAGTADVVLIPEIPFDINKIVAKINERNDSGRNFSIICIAEGAMPIGGEACYKEQGGIKNLGGIGEALAEDLRSRVSNQFRTVVLGHLLRGGMPTARDRLLSFRFGAAAVRGLEEGKSSVMVALDPPTVKYIPLEECTKRIKVVQLDCDTIATARDLGTCLGDE